MNLMLVPLAERALLALEGIRGREWVAVVVLNIYAFGEGICC